MVSQNHKNVLTGRSESLSGISEQHATHGHQNHWKDQGITNCTNRYTLTISGHANRSKYRQERKPENHDFRQNRNSWKTRYWPNLRQIGIDVFRYVSGW